MNQIRNGLTNTLSRDYAGRTIGQILSDSGLKAALGFGGNVQARVNGRAVGNDHILSYGDLVDIETVANRKANNGVPITLRYGMSNKLDVTVPYGTTVKSVLTNESYRAVLGFGSNVIAKVDGAILRDDLQVHPGLIIDLETAANQKAS